MTHDKTRKQDARSAQRREIGRLTRPMSDRIGVLMREHGWHGKFNEAQYTHRRIKYGITERQGDRFVMKATLLSILQSDAVIGMAIRDGKVKVDFTNINLNRVAGTGRAHAPRAYTYICIRIWP